MSEKNGMTRRGLFSLGAAAAVTAAVPNVLAPEPKAAPNVDGTVMIHALVDLRGGTLVALDGVDAEGIDFARPVKFDDKGRMAMVMGDVSKGHFAIAVTEGRVHARAIRRRRKISQKSATRSMNRCMKRGGRHAIARGPDERSYSGRRTSCQSERAHRICRQRASADRRRARMGSR